MRLSLLQINPVVGDLEGNAAKIAEAVRMSRGDLAVTPELALSGYPPRDLLLNSQFISLSQTVLAKLADELQGQIPVLVGAASPNTAGSGRLLFNSAMLLNDGRIEQTFHKTLLPTYDVFDEDRYFEPALSPQILEIFGMKIGVSICEDIWNDRDMWMRRRYHTDPIAILFEAGAQCILNLSASPFTVHKQQIREEMLSGIARKYCVPLLYVNQVGGNDDLVFDGRSMAFDQDGRLFARAQAFDEDVLEVDLDVLVGRICKDDLTPECEIWRALVLGTRDYVLKCGFKRVLLGLSGGIDSALTAAVAAKALGPKNVLGVMMPSPYSSSGSIEDACKLVENLKIQSMTISISKLMASFEEQLRPVFSGCRQDVTEENIQARIRSNLLMALSNKFGYLLLTTGNKSELSVE